MAASAGAAGLSVMQEGRSMAATDANRPLQWLSFSIPDGRHIIVNATIGQPVELILDSGVGDLVLANTLAEKLRLPRIGTVTGMGMTGEAQGQVVAPPPITIGHVVLHPAKATVFDLSGFSAATGRDIVAVVGRDVFENFVVYLDFEHMKLALEAPTAPLSGDMPINLPLLAEARGNRIMPVSVEGRPPIAAIFDLGSDTPLYLSPDYVREKNLLGTLKTSTSLSYGIEGLQLNTVAVLHEIQIGPVQLRNVPIEVPARWRKSVPAYIGLPVLHRFNMRVDCSRNQLSLLPLGAAINRPFRKDRSGIGAERAANGMRVIHIAPGSPAEAAKLHVGDVIVAINGRPLDEAYFRARPHEGAGPAGTHMRLTLATGETVAFDLADYF